MPQGPKTKTPRGNKTTRGRLNTAINTTSSRAKCGPCLTLAQTSKMCSPYWRRALFKTHMDIQHKRRHTTSLSGYFGPAKIPRVNKVYTYRAQFGVRGGVFGRPTCRSGTKKLARRTKGQAIPTKPRHSPRQTPRGKPKTLQDGPIHPEGKAWTTIDNRMDLKNGSLVVIRMHSNTRVVATNVA